MLDKETFDNFSIWARTVQIFGKLFILQQTSLPHIFSIISAY